jgi:hypothetical protein
MRSLAAFVAALIGVAVIGCGGASRHERWASHAAAAVADGAPKGAVLTTTPSGPYLNDGDHDVADDADGDNKRDNDRDPWLDYKPEEKDSRYHDADDRSLFAYGSAVSPVEERAVAAVVERYYAMAAAGDGAGACGLLNPSLAGAVPVDYGRNGPSYLRAGKTCAAVLALLFRHYHRQLAAPVAVTGVRVSGGGQAYAQLGSTTMPASYTVVQREGGVWRLTQLLANENVMP